MNLIVDVGNSYVKLAVFQCDKVLCKMLCSISDFEFEVETIFRKFPEISNCMVSAVGKLEVKGLKLLDGYCEVMQIDDDLTLPFNNLYKSPETLGADRLALISGVIAKGINGHALVIDAGTCITYDFINQQKEYLGGAISAGLKMRYKALHEFTAALPYIDEVRPVNIIGGDTESCMNSGCVNGVLFEIDGVIHSYQAKYQDLTVILTGGDANFLSKQLKSSIFANSNFLLEGLNYLLNYNTKK